MRALPDTEDSGNPFGPDMPAEALYVSTVLQQRLDLIEHLLEFGRQLILLSGEPGAGKTTVLAAMAAAAGERWRCIPLDGGPALDGPGLLAQVADALGCADLDDDDDPDAQPRRLEMARQRIAALEKSGKPVVLLLDDADRVPPDALSVLLALARTEDQSAEARVLMTAATEHSGLIAALQRDRQQHGLVHVVEIPGIAEEETADFLRQRLGPELGTLDDWFTAETIARFAEEANGNPGTLLGLAREASAGMRPVLSRPARSQRQRLLSLLRTAENPSPLRRWAPLALIPLALLAWLVQKPSPPTAPELLPEQTPPTVTAMDATAPTAGPLAAASTGSGTQRIEITLPPTPAAPGEAPNSGAPEASAAAEAVPAAASPPDAPTPSAPALAAGAAVAGAALVEREAATVDSPQAAAPAPAEPPAPAPRPAKAEKKPGPPATKAQARPAKPVAKPATPKAVAKPAAGTSVKAGTGYALQFFGVSERKAASNFIARHKLGDRARIIDSKRDGKPWFIVVYGAYPTRAAAQNAAGRLPPAVQREVRPWVRDVKSLNALPR